MCLPSPRPVVRVLTHLACTGGTIITRCLDAMPGTVIVSEVHPLMGMRRRANPFKQVQAAYGLIDDDDLTRIFVGEMRTLRDRCETRGRTLVVRDHTHADFVEPGFAQRSPAWLRTTRALEAEFDVRSLVTVRHPIDQWLSLRQNGWLDCEIPEFVQRLAAFASIADRLGFERYEDFAEAPSRALGRMCARLDLPFDPGYRERLAEAGRHLTGASGRQSLDIRPRPRPAVEPSVLEEFARAPGYDLVLGLLGYVHPAGTRSQRQTSAA